MRVIRRSRQWNLEGLMEEHFERTEMVGHLVMKSVRWEACWMKKIGD